MGLLATQLSEMKAERTILLDRLALLGMGGPLFNLQPSQDSLPVTEVEEELTEEEQDQRVIASLRRTPSKLAKFIEWKQRRDRNKINRGPDVAYINAALDQAEAAGKR